MSGDEGWPQTWYAWRKIMPTFTSGFRAIAVDPRGLDHPATGTRVILVAWRPICTRSCGGWGLTAD